MSARRWGKWVATVVVIATFATALASAPAGSATRTRTLATKRVTTSTTRPVPTTTTTTRPVHDVTIPPVVDELAPLIHRIPTAEPVVFLTIDDGAHRAPFELQMLQDNGLKATLFLAESFIHGNHEFFVPFVKAGHPIENHSLTHRVLPRLSYDEQVQEICGEADLLEQQFGRRAVFFRPSGGAYNTNTLRAAATCGMRAVVHWSATVDRGVVRYQSGYGLKPGDIVLMHFRPEFAADLTAFMAAARAAGLRTELLVDWLE